MKLKNDHRSKLKKLEKIRTSTGFEPVTSAMSVLCSTNWAMKPRIGSEVNLLSSYIFREEWNVWLHSSVGRACTGIAEVSGSNPVEALIFQASSFQLLKVPLWSKKSLPFFLGILKVCLLNTWLAKFWPLLFIQKLFTLRVNFGFHDPPLLTFKPDRLDLRGLDPGKVTSKAHQLKISVCERSLLYMQSPSLKVWKPKTPVLHINSIAYTRIAFLN